MKKILFVLTQDIDSPSGLGRYWPMARELSQKGWTVEIVALHSSFESLPQKTIQRDGVTIRYVAQMHVMKSGSEKIHFSPLKLLQVSLYGTWRLMKAVWKSDATHLHVGKPQPFNLLAVRFGKRKRPIIIDCDDYEAETNHFGADWQQKIVRYFEDSAVKIADHLTVNTQFTKDRYQAMGYPASQITYVPNGVLRSRFDHSSAEIDRWTHDWYQEQQLSPDTPIVLYIGTMQLHSHPVDLLLHAFQQIQADCPDAKLLLVGGGEDYRALQQMAIELGIGENTIFLGRVAPAEIPFYYALATVTVDPIYDDLIAKARSPLKIVESLLMGTPVITSDVGDRRMMLQDGKCGVFVEAGSAEGLADGLRDLLNDPQKRASLASEALQIKNQLYWDALIAPIETIYS